MPCIRLSILLKLSGSVLLAPMVYVLPRLLLLMMMAIPRKCEFMIVDVARLHATPASSEAMRSAATAHENEASGSTAVAKAGLCHR
jgi:hypothetical protein